MFHIDNNFILSPLDFGNLKLIQLGRSYLKPGFFFDNMHGDFFELTVVNSGSGKISTNDTKATVKNGDIHLSGPMESHGIFLNPAEQMKYDFLAFQTKNPAHHSALKEIISARPCAADRIFQSESVSSVVANAIWEFKNDEYCARELLLNMLDQVIIHTVRAFAPERKKNTLSDEVVSSKILCMQIMNYIDTHIYTIKRLSEISDALNYNYSYLSNLFKVTTGRSITDYLSERRMSLALSMILNQNISITQIAEKLNYYSLYSFSRMFKKRYGCSPDIYRKKHSIIDV